MPSNRVRQSTSSEYLDAELCDNVICRGFLHLSLSLVDSSSDRVELIIVLDDIGSISELFHIRKWKALRFTCCQFNPSTQAQANSYRLACGASNSHVFLFNLKDKAYKVLEVPGMLYALIILPEYSRGVMSVHLNWDGNAPNVHEGLLWECVLQFCAFSLPFHMASFRVTYSWVFVYRANLLRGGRTVGQTLLSVFAGGLYFLLQSVGHFQHPDRPGHRLQLER
jgi:hypothetical protein